MPTLADYARPFEQGIMAGAQIGHTIAQNQIAREKMRRDLEQAQISNAIQERHTRLLEADTALKAEQFQQLNDFQKYVDQTTPSGDLFKSMSPADQEQALHTIGEQQVRHLPAALLPKALESSQADYERQQRLEQVLKAQAERTAATQSAYNLRSESRIDERAAEQDKRIAAAEAAAKKAQDAAQTGREFTQGAIDARASQRANRAAIKYPAGTPAAIYEDLFTAKQGGGQAGEIVDNVYVEGATHHEGGFLGLGSKSTPLDTLINQYSVKVPPATKRKIEAKVIGSEPDQTTPESAPAGEPAAVPVPTETKANEVQRKLRDGRIGIFDADTKKFIRYAD